MPVILMATLMKSGLPTRAVLPLSTHSYSSTLKHTHTGPGMLPSLTERHQEPAHLQIYTDWANHYLAKSGHKQLIKDLQQDVSDGVLLAEIIQVVANEKIEDINGCPKNHSQMVENIDTCLAFLAAKGVNIQGLSAEEIRNGNLKAILGLFFSLSRYKQQQQQQQSSLHTHLTHIQTHTAQTHTASSHGTHASAAQIHRAQAEMQSRLPGPTPRVSGVCVESSSRGSLSSAGNRRSQTFSEKIKPAATQTRESSDAIAFQPPSMTEHAPSSLATTSAATSTVPSSSSASSATSSSAIPQPNSSSKPWRSKSLSAKNMSTSTVSPVKGEVPSKQNPPTDPPPKSLPQKSMLEKLKLFNSKSGSKSSTPPEGAAQMSLMLEKVEATEPAEEANGYALTSSSPKMALKGIAQRTFSRALTAKKGSVKGADKEKDSDKEKERVKEKEKDKERGKETSKRMFTFEKSASKDAVTTEDVTTRSEVSIAAAEPKRTSKIASLIPKGGKTSGKKDSAPSMHSGIPKPGSKGTAKSSGVPLNGKDNERPRSMRLSSGVGFHGDSRPSSSSSSLASTEGKGHQNHSVTSVGNGGTTQSTASNTVSVQLPQPQQQYSHPNTATVAPFMYKSQTDGDDTTETGSPGRTGESVSFSKTNQTSTEDLSGEDPETRRLRTVRNIADLRQNLEETMSSLRGTQVTHSALETFDSGVTMEMNPRAFRSSRAAPLSWTNRLGPSSPRLQAGDAPSPGNGYPAHGGVGGAALGHTRYLYSAPLRRQLAARSSAVCGLELGERGGEELELDVSGYVSDGDVLAKNAHTDELSSGYLTDGGLSLYTRRMNRFPDGLALMRETLQKHVSTGQGDADSWDDSSSVSSGISDTIDTDDINTSSSISSYTHTSASCRALNTQPQTDAEKHSVVERHSSWSCDEVQKSDAGSDSGVKMESGVKWRQNPSDVSDESDKGGSGKRSGAVSQTGSWRRGMSAQVGVTTPRTKNTGPGVMKSHGTAKTDDAKVSEKGRISPHANNIQSCDSAPSRVSFGFKKPSSGSVSGPPATAMTSSTSSRVTVISGSATLGKIPKSTALLVGGVRSGLKGSTPECAMVTQEDGGLVTGVRSTLQYRSLPRPSRSSHNRASISSIESGSSGRGPAISMTIPANKTRESVPSVKTNQTDKEKGGVSDTDNLRANVVGSSSTIPQTARQGSKYTEVSSPTLRRLFGGKAAKQVTTTENLKNSVVISNPHATLGHHSVPSAGLLDSPSAGSSVGAGGSEQVSSPGSGYSGGTGTWGHPSVSSMHTSTESIDMSVSSGNQRDSSHQAITRTGSAKTESPFSSPSASPKFSRNTLPRKQDSRYTPSPQLRPEEARDWLRSHSISGLQDSASNSPFSTGSSVTSPSGTRFNFGQLASPTTAAQLSLMSLRNSSLTNQDAVLDTCNEGRLRNSCVSLDEKTRIMSRSASFRDGFEEVHGSSLSLVSSTSSIYSTNEEKSQSEIRKLRRELDASQEKVSALTTQLSANAHLVAAFEQSLANMTIRLKSLTMTAEQKDTELNELRKTIELLKKQNAVAQAAINGVINTPELTCKPERTASVGSVSVQAEMCMRRQHSSDSVSSITSHSSMENTDNCSRKKKKNWLRSSFKQAFTKKKSPKSASSHSDIEEMNDSLPSSPKLPHNGSSGSTPMLRNSNSLLPEGLDGEAETVMQLRSELREKEMKLTDIRLEALSSAHQLDQLREAMNRMQSEIEKLKAENDRLKMENQTTNGGRALITPSSITPPSAELAQQNLHESTSFDILLDDSGGDGSFHKDGQHVKIVVSLQREDAPWKEECRPRDFLIGCIGVSGKTKWDVLDGVVKRLFKEYIRHVDPVSQLGLSSDSVEAYRIGDVIRPGRAKTPELLPCGYLVGENNTINITLKGVSSQSTDSLVFEMLIPKPVLQRYVSLLHEHRRLILSGPSGTGKTYLAQRLAEHLALLEGRTDTHTAIATFSVDHKSSKELRQYLLAVVEQCSVDQRAAPLVIILDNLHHISSLGEIFNGLLNQTRQHCPYIIGTMSQTTSSSPNLQLHHNFRWVLCANHTEPVKGFLGRFLRRKLIETEISSRTRNPELVKIVEWIPRLWHHLNCFLEAHSSSDVTIGPRLFLSCPMDVDGSRIWFTDLWNYSIIPYMLEAVREGLQLYGRRAAWDDPARWVLETFPWQSSTKHPDWPALLKLRPEDVGLDGGSTSKEGATKQSIQSDSDADPLMNMLMRLKEAANCSSTQSYDSDSNSNGHHDDILDSSLESTL
ncbi:neuron navigator 2 isoform X2 [Hemibagrus wyckioides]|uniref:neuron navigator 2 isoform X2 n=1 Tax=Hemibagrus wyckioides TaxID=337641 RepID=UPI00266B3EA9|nr:neuron navigator 2 isoform X2 [Hemibagrus wyckioides]